MSLNAAELAQARNYTHLIVRSMFFHNSLDVNLGIESRDVDPDRPGFQGRGCYSTMSPQMAERVLKAVITVLDAGGRRCVITNDPTYNIPHDGWGGCVLWWDPRPVSN